MPLSGLITTCLCRKILPTRNISELHLAAWLSVKAVHFPVVMLVMCILSIELNASTSCFLGWPWVEQERERLWREEDEKNLSEEGRRSLPTDLGAWRAAFCDGRLEAWRGVEKRELK